MKEEEDTKKKLKKTNANQFSSFMVLCRSLIFRLVVLGKNGFSFFDTERGVGPGEGGGDEGISAINVSSTDER